MNASPNAPQRALKILCAAVSLATGSAVCAENLALEEVVVTAQKREESSQKTPISLAAFSTADLENKGINSLVDLRSEVPNLQLTPHPNSTTTTRVFMRGVGNNDDQITQDPSVAVYLDGVYVARSQGLASDVADIERVEVLRGPQGSLYGRNATGGAINFITKAPELGRFGFQQALTVGNSNLLRSRTQADLPLGETAALELSYLKVSKNGYADNPGSGVSRWGDQDRSAYRAALHWQPIDAVDIRYSYDHSQIDDTPGLINYSPNFPQIAKRPSSGSPFVNDLRANDITAQGHNLTIAWEIEDSLTLKSITGYRKLDNYTDQNYLTDALTGTGNPLASLFVGKPVFITEFDSSQHQFSEELQASGDTMNSQLEYVAGLYYFSEKADSYDTTVSVQGLDERWVTIDNSAYAAFGQGTYTPSILDEQLHITLGLRYSHDNRKATMDTLHSAPNGAAPATYNGGANPFSGDGNKSFHDLSPSMIVAYDVDADINVYGKIAKGYKTGGYNVRAPQLRFGEGFDQENLISYELGLKSQWWDNRVRFNSAVFLAKYDDIQVNVQSDPNNASITDVLNAGKATISGAEVELSGRLTEGLTAALNYAYLDASFDKVRDANGTDVTSQFQFPEAPHNSYSVNLQYEFPATPIGVFTAMADYSWQSEKFSASNAKPANGSLFIIDDYALLNARLNLSEIPVGTGSLRASLWGRNLEDKHYYTSLFDLRVAQGAFYGEPRSYGIDLVYQY
jgi:iron complex outermembrane receptor protein